MKIGYLVPGRSFEPEEGARRRRILESFQSGDLTITMLESDEGPPAIESAEDEAAAIPSLVELAQTHEDAFDVFITGCFADVGIEELRKNVSIPIIGPGRAAYAVAGAAHPTFAILAINLYSVTEERGKMKTFGFSNQEVVIRSLDLHVATIIDEPEQALMQITNAAQQCHAPAFIPGCMSMAFLLEEHNIVDVGITRVVNPLRCAIRLAVAITS